MIVNNDIDMMSVGATCLMKISRSEANSSSVIINVIIPSASGVGLLQEHVLWRHMMGPPENTTILQIEFGPLTYIGRVSTH